MWSDQTVGLAWRLTWWVVASICRQPRRSQPPSARRVWQPNQGASVPHTNWPFWQRPDCALQSPSCDSQVSTLKSQAKSYYNIKKGTTASTTTHALLNVLKQEGRGAQVVNGYVEEALDFLLMQIHGNYMRQTRGAHHFGQQLRHNAATFAHFTLLRVRQIGYDADYGASRRCLASIGHDEQLHNVVVSISKWNQ